MRNEAEEKGKEKNIHNFDLMILLINQFSNHHLNKISIDFNFMVILNFFQQLFLSLTSSIFKI